MDESLLTSIRLAATSLAIGLLIGIERERKADSRGLRTFALVSLLGALMAGLSRLSQSPAVLAVGLAVIGLMAVAAYWHDSSEAVSTALEKPTTSVVAMMVTGCLGMLCGLGREDLAVPLAIVVASLLFFKGELSGIAGRIGRDDLIPILQFGALSFIVLPLLPDRSFGPAGAFNPHNLWLMVVLVAGVSLAGYLALRFAGQRYGAPLAAVAGGLVSSTVTTLVFARHARTGGDPNVAARMVLLANLTLMVRLMAMTALIEPRLLVPVATVMGAGVAAGALSLMGMMRMHPDANTAWPMPTVRHPMQMREALGFALAYGLVSMGAGLAAARVGNTALYGLAGISGLTDLDAITLSSLRLFGTQAIGMSEAIIALTIAVCANMSVKTVITFVAGGPAFGRRCLPGLALMTFLAAGAAWWSVSVAA